MPHLVIDCSESVLRLADPGQLMRTVYDAAESTGLFEVNGVGGIKVRISPYRDYLNVDGHEHFVHVFGYIMEGRSQEQKRLLSTRVVRVLKTLLPTVEIIAMNVADFEKATYCNAPMVQADGGALDGPLPDP
jgi:5-carboxymethyl-2-hydroxymuconate isomerase